MTFTYLKLFDVGIVDPKTELVEFVLDTINDLLFEDLALLEDLLHRHAGNNDTGLPFDDALDDVLDMVTLGGHDGPSLTGWTRAVWVARQEKCVLLERIQVIVRADGKDGWQSELEFLHRHCLEIQRKVEWRDGDAGASLPWFDERFLGDPNIVDVGTSDDEILIRFCDAIPQ